jgi:hypothetical protein
VRDRQGDHYAIESAIGIFVIHHTHLFKLHKGREPRMEKVK